MAKNSCYFIPTDQVPHPTKGYTPAIAVRGQKGYRMMTGQSEDQEPWYWGDLEQAKENAVLQNSRRGISPIEADRIVVSTM